MFKPKVASIVANYNYSQYLDGCIKSLINQTYPNFITICDDASTDNSREILKQYCQLEDIGDYFYGKNDQFLIIGLKERKGPSYVRNILIKEIIDYFDIINITDADDEAYPQKIEKCIVPFEDPGTGVVWGDYDILNVETSNLIREYKEPYNFLRLRQECIVHSNALIKTQALMKVMEITGWYDCRLVCAEDYDLWLRISEQFMLHHIPEAVSLVRVHNNSSVHYRSKDIWNKNWQIVANKAKQRDENRNKK